MPARSGQQYLESLKANQPEVWLDGERIEDVTTHPIFAGPIRSVMEQYDLQLSPEYRDVCLYESPTTGDLVSTSFMAPRSREDLVKKRQQFKLRADQNFGLMGRSPDFMNAYVLSMALNAEAYARHRPEARANALAIYEHARENDLFMTHVLVNPQIDRSKKASEQEDPFTYLGRVGETAEGIIIRGAKMLGTMAPLTEELVVTPFGGTAEGDDAYALVFAIPTNTPGVKFVCREPFATPAGTSFDHPLSSRFEEMDCIAIFDDVLVPWDRVIIDGSPGSGKVTNAIRHHPGGCGLLQTSSRVLSSMEFMAGLAMEVADAIGITGFLHVQEKLGEMLLELEMAKAMYFGSTAMASEDADGYWLPYLGGLSALQMHLARQVHPRMVEIIQILVGGGVFYAPMEKDLKHEELGPLLAKYVKGREGVSAERRVALFKLAWETVGSAFGQRVNQYVRYYSGDPVRNTAGLYVGYDKQPLFDIIDRCLEGVDHRPIPLSPEDPARVKKSAPTGLAGSYPAASLPSSVTVPVT